MPGSPAALAGCKVGDKIIGLNGQLLLGATHSEVIEALRTSGTNFALEIRTAGDTGTRTSNSVSPARQVKSPAKKLPPKANARTSKTYTVTLKGPALGMTLKTDAAGNQQVAAISNAGSAKTSALVVGDAIHAVGSKTISGTDHAAVVLMIKAELASAGAVTLGYTQ